MEPKGFNLGLGFMISPMTILLASLLPLSVNNRPKKISKSDILLIIFLLLSTLSFLIFPYENTLYGILSLAEIIALYYLLRINISEDNHICQIFISILMFQTGLGLIQNILGRPIGILAESINITNPEGYTASEDINLFRITGTFGHPNFYASFLLVLYPFLFFYKSNNKIIGVFKYLVPVAIVFTYSRVAWVIFALFIVYQLFEKYKGKGFCLFKIEKKKLFVI
ncbi:MAG: hypothetical protein ACD_20C00370G0002, partial [uncultured bacterium]